MHGRAIKIIALILVAMFVLPLSVTQMVHFFFQSSPWIASVNKYMISPEDITRRVIAQDYQLQMVRQRFGEYADFYIKLMGLDHNPEQMALDNAVRDELLNQVVAKIGWRLPAEYVAEKLSDPLYIIQNLPDIIPAHLVDQQGISAAALRHYLRQINLTAAEFDDRVVHALERKLLDAVITKTTYVPQFVLHDYAATEFSGKRFSIATLSLDEFLKKEVARGITAQELQAFFDAKNTQEKRYLVPETRSGLVWRFDPAHYGITIDSKAVSDYYNAHKNDYKDKGAQVQVRRILIGNATPLAHEKAEKIHDQLAKEPGTFAAAATANSDDKATAAQGGLMPLFAQGSHDREFEKAAFALQTKGALSPILRTKDGYEILQLVEKKAATYKPLSAVENEIKSRLAQQQFNSRFALDARKAIEEGKTDPQAIADFITKKQGKRTVVTNTSAAQSSFIKSLFRIAPGAYAVDMEGDLGVLVQLTEVAKAHTPTLASIENKVKNDLYAQRAEQAFDAALRSYLRDAQGKTGAEFAALFGGKVEKTEIITPRDKVAIDKLAARGITPARIFQLEKVGMVTVAKGDGKGYIVKLDAIEPFNKKEFEEQKTQIKQQIQGQEEQLVFGGFVASLYRSATIKQNKSMMNS